MNVFPPTKENVDTWTRDNADDWTERGARQLTARTLQQLINNYIPYIRFRLVSEVACHDLGQRLAELAFGSYRAVEPRIDRIGCTVFEYNAVGAEDYFAASKVDAELRDCIFSQTFDPLQMVMRELSKRTERRASIAENSKGQRYYAGLIRRIELGTELHIDFAPVEQSNWSVCEVQNQLTWNLYVKVGRGGSGRTTIYRRQWQPRDALLREGSYGFSHRAIAGSEYVTFQPLVGEVVLFNTRNYHIVDPSIGDRITVGSAIGEIGSGDLILWS
jgi:hypothetical protein